MTHEVTLIMKILIISVTYHTPQNRVSDTSMHVTLNTINNVVLNIVFFVSNSYNIKILHI